MLKAAVLLSFIGSASAFASAPNDPPQGPLNITLSSGDVVQGYTQKYVNLTKAFVRSFRGIKFGEAARWMPPNFTAFHQYMGMDGMPINGHACPWIMNMYNESFDPPFNAPLDGTNMALAFDYATSEDCLNLNVFTPVSKPKEPLPVVIWLHGGSNVAGSATSHGPIEWLVNGMNNSVIVVSVNSRLAALGFLALEVLAAEDPRNVSGNYAILDQQLAMRWVQREIEHFGGDPNKVFLLGQSSGGTNIMAHLIAPESVPLFAGAISLSGSPNITMNKADKYEQDRKYWLDNTPCNDTKPADEQLACMRNLSVAEVMQAMDKNCKTDIEPNDTNPFPIEIACSSGGGRYNLWNQDSQVPVDPSLHQMGFGLPFIDGHTLDGGSDSSILTGLKKTFSNASAPAVIFQTLSAEHNWPPSNAFTKAGYDALAASDDEHGARNGARNLLEKQLGVCVSDGDDLKRPCCQSCTGSPGNASDNKFGNTSILPDFLDTVWKLAENDTENISGDPLELYPAYALTADAGATCGNVELALAAASGGNVSKIFVSTVVTPPSNALFAGSCNIRSTMPFHSWDYSAALQASNPDGAHMPWRAGKMVKSGENFFTDNPHGYAVNCGKKDDESPAKQPYQPSPRDVEFGKQLLDQWLAFIKTGKPGWDAVGSSNWSDYQHGKITDKPAMTVPSYKRPACDNLKKAGVHINWWWVN